MFIFLTGYMACGKSTIGRKLKSRLNLPLYDTDKEIVAREDMSVADIFALKGEEYFRGVESTVIKELIASNKDAIISTGGGAPTWGDNMEIMNQTGLTIYLSRTAENIASRLSAHGREKRPKLRGLNDSEIVTVMRAGIEERDVYYRQSKLVIEANSCTDDMIIEKIVTYLKSHKMK